MPHYSLVGSASSFYYFWHFDWTAYWAFAGGYRGSTSAHISFCHSKGLTRFQSGWSQAFVPDLLGCKEHKVTSLESEVKVLREELCCGGTQQDGSHRGRGPSGRDRIPLGSRLWLVARDFTGNTFDRETLLQFH